MCFFSTNKSLEYCLFLPIQPNADALELAVEQLRKTYLESRQRGRPGQGTPPTVTTVDRSNGSHNAWGGFISRTIPATTTVGGLNVPNSNTNATGGGGAGTNDQAVKTAPSKRSHSRSRSRSRSRSPNDDGRSRQRKKSRHRSPQAFSKYGGGGGGGGGGNNTSKKKSSRNYSRSPSSSPHNSKHGRKR